MQALKAPVAVKTAQKKAKKAKGLQSQNAQHSVHDAVRLTPGGAAYIECVLNPRTGPLARVPYGFPVRSRTVRTKCIGTFTASATTAGATAMCVLNPWRMIFNDVTCAYATGSASTCVDTTLISNSAGNLDQPFTANSDYGSTSLTSNTIAYRLVGAELGVSVVSSALSRQGSLVVMTEPSHENVLNQFSATIAPNLTANILMSGEGCRVRGVPMSNAVERCVWGTPEKPGETEWLSYGQLTNELTYLTAAGMTSSQANSYLAGDAGYGAYYGFNMIAIAPGGTTGGASGTATVYRFEAYAVFEIVGSTITGRGPGCSDPIAFQAASNWIQRTPGSTQVPGTARDALSYLGQQMGYVDRKGDVVWGAVGKTAASAAAYAATLF